jgi:hypothetical protein
MVSSFPFSARPTATPARQPTRRHRISLAFRTRPASLLLLLLSKSPWRTYSTPRCVESFCFSLFYFRLGLANGLEIATSYIMSFLIVLAFLIATAMSLQHLVMCRSG